MKKVRVLTEKVSQIRASQIRVSQIREAKLEQAKSEQAKSEQLKFPQISASSMELYFSGHSFGLFCLTAPSPVPRILQVRPVPYSVQSDPSTVKGVRPPPPHQLTGRCIAHVLSKVLLSCALGSSPWAQRSSRSAS